jgi:hypothetical protein
MAEPAAPNAQVWAIVPCMGRLLHLRRTLPRLLQAELSVMVVDWGCPDGCGGWALGSFPQQSATGRLAIARATAQRFHKTAAHNLGARLALERGATRLCFIDADTLVQPEFGAWCRRADCTGRFWIVKPSRTGRDLTGLLLLSAEDFRNSGGFDVGFVDYGAEDLELRLRLRLVHRLEYGFVPQQFVSSIAHGDELRTRYYVYRNPRTSHLLNLHRLDHRVRSWTGRGVRELRDRSLRPLLTQLASEEWSPAK